MGAVKIHSSNYYQMFRHKIGASIDLNLLSEWFLILFLVFVGNCINTINPKVFQLGRCWELGVLYRYWGCCPQWIFCLDAGSKISQNRRSNTFAFGLRRSHRLNVNCHIHLATWILWSQLATSCICCSNWYGCIFLGKFDSTPTGLAETDREDNFSRNDSLG